MAVGVSPVLTVPEGEVPTVAVNVGAAVAVGVSPVVTVMVAVPDTGIEAENDKDVVPDIEVVMEVENDPLIESDMLGVPEVVPDTVGNCDAP